MGSVHRATFVGVGKIKNDGKDGSEQEYERVILECFPPPHNKLLLIFNRPPWTYWSFLNVEAERHNDKEERIKGVPAFDTTGESEAIIDLYKIPAIENEARFKAEFKYDSKEWKIDFKGNQTNPL